MQPPDYQPTHYVSSDNGSEGEIQVREVRLPQGGTTMRRVRIESSEVIGITLPMVKRCDQCRRGGGRDCKVGPGHHPGVNCNTCRERHMSCTWHVRERSMAQKRKASEEAEPTTRNKRARREVEANAEAGPSASGTDAGLTNILRDIRDTMREDLALKRLIAERLQTIAEGSNQVAEALEELEFKAEFWMDAMGHKIRKAMDRYREEHGESSGDSESGSSVSAGNTEELYAPMEVREAADEAEELREERIESGNQGELVPERMGHREGSERYEGKGKGVDPRERNQ
jgi:hypothetical protein